MTDPRVLFILKFRNQYGTDYGACDYSQGYTSSGLFNSAHFINDMLANAGVTTKLVEVNDNNDIDREVTAFRPTVVIIEALWVIPSKFAVLTRLHPDVKWIVRCHSDISFLANESIGVEWLIDYLQFDNVYISCNAESPTHDVRDIIEGVYRSWPKHIVDSRVIYLPNYYPIDSIKVHHSKYVDEFLDVCCFGAIRPLKNQLIQGLAAIEAAEKLGKKLRFHINGTRCEQGGSTTLTNLTVLFDRTGNELVLHGWETHEEFMSLLISMDVGLQVSFSETFNIVAADMVAAGLPVVVSPEVNWTSVWSHANPNNARDITEGILRVLGPFQTFFKTLNVHNLSEFAEKSKRIWLEQIEHDHHNH